MRSDVSMSLLVEKVLPPEKKRSARKGPVAPPPASMDTVEPPSAPLLPELLPLDDDDPPEELPLLDEVPPEPLPPDEDDPPEELAPPDELPRWPPELEPSGPAPDVGSPQAVRASVRMPAQRRFTWLPLCPFAPRPPAETERTDGDGVERVGIGLLADPARPESTRRVRDLGSGRRARGPGAHSAADRVSWMSPDRRRCMRSARAPTGRGRAGPRRRHRAIATQNDIFGFSNWEDDREASAWFGHALRDHFRFTQGASLLKNSASAARSVLPVVSSGCWPGCMHEVGELYLWYENGHFAPRRRLP